MPTHGITQTNNSAGSSACPARRPAPTAAPGEPRALGDSRDPSGPTCTRKTRSKDRTRSGHGPSTHGSSSARTRERSPRPSAVNGDSARAEPPHRCSRGENRRAPARQPSRGGRQERRGEPRDGTRGRQVPKRLPGSTPEGGKAHGARQGERIRSRLL